MKRLFPLRVFVFGGVLAVLGACASRGPAEDLEHLLPPTPEGSDAMTEPDQKVVKNEDEWRRELTPEQYYVLREKGTERAFTGQYYATKDSGVYHCAACGHALFSSDAKFDSGTGWPSFYAPMASGKVAEHTDRSWGMSRTEVLCGRCDSHLGHVFDDGPKPTGLRYCINSVCLKLRPDSGD